MKEKEKPESVEVQGAGAVVPPAVHERAAAPAAAGTRCPSCGEPVEGDKCHNCGAVREGKRFVYPGKRRPSAPAPVVEDDAEDVFVIDNPNEWPDYECEDGKGDDDDDDDDDEEDYDEEDYDEEDDDDEEEG